MSNDFVAEHLQRQSNRAIRAILEVKDQCDEYLPHDLKYSLRKTVLDQVNGLTTFATDLMKALDSDAVLVNEQWVEAKLQIMLDRQSA